MCNITYSIVALCLQTVMWLCINRQYSGCEITDIIVALCLETVLWLSLKTVLWMSLQTILCLRIYRQYFCCDQRQYWAVCLQTVFSLSQYSFMQWCGQVDWFIIQIKSPQDLSQNLMFDRFKTYLQWVCSRSAPWTAGCTHRRKVHLASCYSI